MYVSLSTMDKYWYPGIGREEALGVLKKCMAEAQHRELPVISLTGGSVGWSSSGLERREGMRETLASASPCAEVSKVYSGLLSRIHLD